MKKQIMNKAVRLLIVLLLGTAVLSLGMTGSVYATTGKTAKIYHIQYPRSGDKNFRGPWGKPGLKHMNGWKGTANKGTLLRAVGSYSGTVGYCIEPGVTQKSGDMLKSTDEHFFDNISARYNHVISPEEIKLLMGRILAHGYCGNASVNWYSQNASDAEKIAEAYATQLLVWEVVVGERNASFDHISPTNESPILDSVNAKHPLRNQIMKHYRGIEGAVKQDSMLPGFCSYEKENAGTELFRWDGEKYIVTMEDKNRVLEQFEFSSSDPGMTLRAENNFLTVSCTELPGNIVTITAVKKNAVRKGIEVWTDGKFTQSSGTQDVIVHTHNIEDRVQGYVNLKAEYGSCKIIKTSEDGKISEKEFTVEGPGICKTVRTDKKGEALIVNLPPGTYHVTEKAGQEYVPQPGQEITVRPGECVSVKFHNTVKKGSLKVMKTSEDGMVSGVGFRLSGTAVNGEKIDKAAVTDEKGTVEFTDIPISGEKPYILEETGTDKRYVIPEKEEVLIEWNKVVEKKIENKLKKFSVQVKKQDKENGKPQGDAGLSGAVYGIYQGEELVDKYVTDANGCFATKEYICGEKWSLREMEPSEGYLLDESVYTIGAEPGLYTVEHNKMVREVPELVIKGKIQIVKHTDDGKTQIETPEEGALFEVYLKSSKSYERTAPEYRDRITCDKNGYACTKELPYGTYTVHQIKGKEGSEKIRDFDVFISENGKSYSYIINDAVFKSYIKIIKADAETGKPIPYKGAGFEIYDPDGEKIAMKCSYPVPMEISTFYTDEKGTLVTPQELKYGKGYSLVEVQAPYGYVLNKEPVYFDIEKNRSEQENGFTVVRIVKQDFPQKGNIIVYKTGEYFQGVEVNSSETEGTIYKPVYEKGYMEGAEFEIYAEKDIYTPEGTLRYKKGQVVDKIRTNPEGIAKSCSLYLGTYLVKETKAPEGQVLDASIQKAELSYAGQEIELTDAVLTQDNQRQRAELVFHKQLEKNKSFGLGTEKEMKNVKFGLYADEELVSKSGTSIPKDGLIELIIPDSTGKSIVKTELPFGKYYIKEIQTDEHYLVSPEKYLFTFEYGNAKEKVIKLTINGDKSIDNRILYGKLEGQKTDEENHPLEGALVGIFRPGTKNFIRENALTTCVSDKNGYIHFDMIPYGKWIVREIQSPQGYRLCEKETEVSIEKDSQKAEFELVNHKIKGSLELLKFDREYPDNKLMGAEFSVYLDTNTNKIQDKEDVYIGNMKEIEKGIYRMENLPYGRYLVKEKKAPEGFKLDKNTYPVFIEEEKTYQIENEAGKGFSNQAKTGSMKIIKTSTDKVVRGFLFHITGENGYDAFYETDKNGEIVVENLRIGNYTVSEVKNQMTADYICPKDRQTEITEDRITEVKMHNKRIPSPQTGDKNNPGKLILTKSYQPVLQQSVA